MNAGGNYVRGVERESFVFHLPDGDESLSAGDRLVVESGVEHSATVGPAGVRCAEVQAP